MILLNCILRDDSTTVGGDRNRIGAYAALSSCVCMVLGESHVHLVILFFARLVVLLGELGKTCTGHSVGGRDMSLQYVRVIATKDNRSIPAAPLHITTRGYHITSSHTTGGAIKEEIKNKEKKIHAFPIFFRLHGTFKRSSTSNQKYQHPISIRVHFA